MPTKSDRPVALVTGAAKRLGRAMATGLAQRGMHVIVHYRNSRSEAEQTAKELAQYDGQAIAMPAELADEQSVKELFATIQSEFGRLDVLVNNASLLEFQPLLSLTYQQWQAGLDPLHGVFLCCREALPMMHRQEFGRVINITDSSADRLYGADQDTPYRIGKTGILLLTKSLAKCATRPNVTINSISPGTIEDSQTKPDPSDIPAGRYAEYSDILQAMDFLIDGKSHYISGANIKVTGGWDV